MNGTPDQPPDSKARQSGPRDARARESGPPESLRREILAILVLYLAVAVLPLLIGMAFAP